MARKRRPPKGPRGGPTVDENYRTLLAERITARMHELGINPAEVVEQTGIGISTIYNILRVEKSNPQLSVLMAISKALKVPFAWLVGETDNFRRVENHGRGDARTSIVGRADATAYVTAMPKIGLALRYVRDTFAIIPTDPRIADAPRYAIEVCDSHLEGLDPPVLQGYLAHYVDISEADLGIENGKIYLLNRGNGVGGWQSTFWQATVYRDRIEFAPRSKDETYNKAEAFSVAHDELSRSDLLKIGGLFYAAMCDYS